MRIYGTGNGSELFDRYTLRKILGVSRSKLHRELNKMTDKVEVSYKNQLLYDELTTLRLMERILFEKLDKMELNGNEF
jgi:hypothetical protein